MFVSRFPTFIAITEDKLSKVDKAEPIIKALGVRQVRVRRHNDLARIEIDKDELPLFFANPDNEQLVTAKLKELGYKEVIIT